MSAEQTSTDGGTVWALTGRRHGDNQQVEALAAAVAANLGLRVELKPLEWRSKLGWTPLYGRQSPSLAPLSEAARAQITPPWPDLVISIGWRSSPVARWVGREGRAKLVHIGRPRAPLDGFDLILTTPQYALPPASNVIELDRPVTGLDREALARECSAWEGRLVHLPRPWTAVMVGGNAPPLRLTEDAAIRLAARAQDIAGAGSLLIATSPRTGQTAGQALMGALKMPHYGFIWGAGDENPYRAFLALADRFIVTSDSVSMAHEATLTGKPVHLFKLPAGGSWPLRALQWIDRRLDRSAVYQSLIRDGWIYGPRRTGAFHDRLVSEGCASWIGSSPPSTGSGVRPASLDQAVDAVGKVLADP